MTEVKRDIPPKERTGQTTGPGREASVFEGIGVAPGIAIGPVYVYARHALTVEHRTLKLEEVDAEVERFEQAVTRAERDLNKIKHLAREKLGDESANIFEAQLLMLRDEALYGAVREYIARDYVNADFAVMDVMTQHRQRLEANDSEFWQERAQDLIDVQDRIITYLRRGKIVSAIQNDAIVVSENLTAADVLLFSRKGILGCALNHGGATSHVSIMARALGVPTVVSLHGLTDHVKDGDLIILDGLEGHIILDPDEETLARYRLRQERFRRLQQEQRQLAPLPAETLDGHRICLRANIEFLEELDVLAAYGPDGIGLLRTEVMLLMQGRLAVSESEQFMLYKRVVEAIRPALTTFRLLDLGGDKMLPVAHREFNPFLGWRGIRVLLDRPEVMIPQVRAFLRASAYGPVRLLAPMVTTLEEVRVLREVISSVQDDLRAEGHPFDDKIPLGIMVEVPAVALRAEHFAAEVDFFSLGTNDLTQYTLAVDRGNDLVSGLYQELDPAVLTLIQHTIKAAHAQGLPVSICGEMGSNPRATPILVGLGIDEISASPSYLPEVKRVIRALNLPEAQDLARRALVAKEAREVVAMLDAWLVEHGCGMINLVEGSV